MQNTQDEVAEMRSELPNRLSELVKRKSGASFLNNESHSCSVSSENEIVSEPLEMLKPNALKSQNSSHVCKVDFQADEPESSFVETPILLTCRQRLN